jgi:hypothetical protein
MSATDAGNDEAATKVVVSYPEGLSDWGRSQIETDRYRGYLRRVLDDVEVGEEFEEFADVGCCGDTLDIPFRVEAVDGPGRVGPETVVELTTREGDVEGGWLVQSQACEWDEGLSE